MHSPLRDFLSSIENKDQIVTPSSLMASALAHRVATERIARGSFTWERCAIHSIDVWLSSCWQEVRYNAPDIPVLLSPSQEILLWRQVIEADGRELFDFQAAAQLARRAALLTAEWHVPLEAAEWSENGDALRFHDWYIRFKRLCADKGFITRADLWRLVPEWMANGLFSPGKVLFWEFSSPSPAFRNLIRAMGELATVAARNPHEPSMAAAKVCESWEQEIEYAARWARAEYEARPGKSIAIFVPDLSTHRARLERIFRHVFYPACALRFDEGRSPASPVFHIAAAGPLDNHPVAANALLLLELMKPRISLSDAGAILRSPFVHGADSGRSQRAQADLLLRNKRELELTFAELQHVAANCPIFARILNAILALKKKQSFRQDLASWSEFIGDFLQAAGWPGDNELTSSETEAVECWNSALSEVGTLGLVSNAVPYASALTQLRRIVSGSGVETGDSSSPVQILDAHAAAGLEFDRAFVMGLGEELWPPVHARSSLIPLALQRSSQVPCSSPESVQDEHRRAAVNLFSSAPAIAASYSGRLSPFAAPYVETVDELSQWTGLLPRQSFPTAVLDQLADSDGPAYSASEETRGGTGIIKSQSLCPFRAFAEYRLNASFPDDACFGFDPLRRGGFLHKTLEFVWNRLESQEALLSVSEAKLQSIVEEAVSMATERKETNDFQQQVTRVERERLIELALEWLNKVERLRLQAFTVEKIEQERTFKLDDLKLRLRIDRVDRLENGKLLLIDYKSGETSRAKLEGDRPAEPQLLIYAAAMGGEVDGVFFGQLKPRHLKLVGISQERQVPGRTSEVRSGEKWDRFLRVSQENMERLAHEFVRGRAAVDPMKGACDYCRIAPLCRVREMTPQDNGLGIESE